MIAINLRSVNWFMVWSMITAMFFIGCSNSDEEVPEITFPELKEINCAADQTALLSFSAPVNWEISSNAGWCKFKDGDFTQSSMSGKAGNQTVTIEISADGQGYDKEDVAQITMKMDGKSQVIYKVTRSKKEHAPLIITDAEGNQYDAMHPLTIKGNMGSKVVYTILKAEADKDSEIGVTGIPEWLVLNNNQETGMYEFTFNLKSKLGVQYPIAQGDYSLTFETTTGSKVQIPLIYEGIQAESVIISPTHLGEIAQWDGKIIVNGSVSEYLTSMVTAQNDKFVPVEFIQAHTAQGNVYDFFGNGEVDWVETKIEKNKVTVTLADNNNTDSRGAIVMLFPQATYDKIKGDLHGNIIDSETKDIRALYADNLMVDLKQEGFKEQDDRITFRTEYCYVEEDDITAIKIKDIEDNSQYPVTLIDLKDDPAYADLGVKGNNVWKAVIPKQIKKLFTYEQECEMVVEAMGIANDQKIEELTSMSSVSSRELTGDAWNQDLYEATGGREGEGNGWITVTGIALTFNNPETYANDYKLVVKDKDGSILALCIIEIVQK